MPVLRLADNPPVVNAPPPAAPRQDVRQVAGCGTPRRALRPRAAALARAWLRAALLAVVAGSAAGQSLPVPATDAVVTVSVARFQPLAALDQAPAAVGGPSAEVSLPHRWDGRGPSRLPAALYQLQFEAEPGAEMLALRFEMASERAELRLNGVLLHEAGSARRAQHVYRAMPMLVAVPPDLVRAGLNTLELRVEHGQSTRAMLSAMEFGPLDRVTERHQQWRRWLVEIPQNANLLAMSLAALLILVWLRRRQEHALGYFGVLYLTGSWRNYGYYSDVIFPAAAWDGIQFVTVIWNGTLALLFAAHYVAPARDAVPWRRTRTVVVAWAGVLSVLAVLAVALDPGPGLSWLRKLAYPWLLPLNLFTAWVFIAHAARSRRWPEGLMAATYGVLVASGLHDNLMVFGVIDGLRVFSLPYAMPVLMAVFSVVMLNRVLEAMRVAEDLTQALEQRVADRTRDLAAANEAKSRFLAAASHDLRQPLNAIALLVGLLRERIRYPEVRALVDKAQATVEGMSGLLRGLLDLSRLEGDQVRLRVEPVALQPLLAGILATDLPQAQARGLVLRVARSRAVVLSDRTLLESLLRNLVANAIRYTPRGRVLVGVRHRGGRAWLQVIDTGVGIPEHERERVFEEFFRGRAAEGGETGFGLGLSIVQRSARLLGHPLDLQSTPGQGTCVQIGLPLAPREDWGIADATAVPVVDGRHRARIAGCFVALIEDQATERDAVASLLRQWGCHVVQGANLEELATALQQHLRQPDLLLSDYRLGQGANGLDALAALRDLIERPEAPALLLTAETTESVLAHARRCGVPVLHKPISPARLCEAMARQLPDPC